jgi:hypothetical protein
MKNIPFAIAIEVRYHGPTDTKGARVSLRTAAFAKPHTVFVPYDYGLGGAPETALDWLKAHGIFPICECETEKSVLLIVKPEDHGLIRKAFLV